MKVLDNLKLFNYLNNMMLERMSKGTVTLGGGFDDKPTQKDKPSAHSSLSLLSCQKLAYAAVKRGALLEGGRKLSYTTVANTNSMEPFIDDNCVVILEETPVGTEFWAGDVVIYRAPSGNLIIHSLKEKVLYDGEPGWIIQGKNNFLPDMVRLKEKDIIKRYVGHFVSVPKRKGD